MLLSAALPHQAALVQGPAPSPSTSSNTAAAAAPWAPAGVQQRHRRRRAALRASSSSGSGGLSYKDAGVDIDAGNELVKRIQKLNPNIGGFSGMVPFGAHSMRAMSPSGNACGRFDCWQRAPQPHRCMQQH